VENKHRVDREILRAHKLDKKSERKQSDKSSKHCFNEDEKAEIDTEGAHETGALLCMHRTMPERAKRESGETFMFSR